LWFKKKHSNFREVCGLKINIKSTKPTIAKNTHTYTNILHGHFALVFL